MNTALLCRNDEKIDNLLMLESQEQISSGFKVALLSDSDNKKVKGYSANGDSVKAKKIVEGLFKL